MSDAIMIRSRLKVLIDQRNIARLQAGQSVQSMRQLAIDSGVPASVLTGLVRNKVERMDFKTLDRLCRFLNCTSGDILEYVPDQA
jgi:DNA-binding Xre family transcriptional regulator